MRANGTSALLAVAPTAKIPSAALPCPYSTVQPASSYNHDPLWISTSCPVLHGAHREWTTPLDRLILELCILAKLSWEQQWQHER